VRDIYQQCLQLVQTVADCSVTYCLLLIACFPSRWPHHTDNERPSARGF